MGVCLYVCTPVALYSAFVLSPRFVEWTNVFWDAFLGRLDTHTLFLSVWLTDGQVA